MEEQARTDPPRPQPTRDGTESPRERSGSRPRKAPPPAVLFQPPAADQPAPRKSGDGTGGRPESEASHPPVPLAGPKPRKAGARNVGARKATGGEPHAETAKAATPKPARTAKSTSADSTATKRASTKSAAAKATPAQSAAATDTAAKSAKAPAKVAKKAARKATAKKTAPEPLPGLPPQHEPAGPPAPRAASAAGTGSAEPAVPPQVAAPITERSDSPAAPLHAPEPAGETPGDTAAEPPTPATTAVGQPHSPSSTAADQPLDPATTALVRVDEAPDLPADPEAPNLPADRSADLAVPVTGTPALAVLRRFAAQPAYAPELLALAAVQSLGPTAQSWAAELRSTYPHVTTAGLVRLATGRYDRMAKVGGALASLAGFAGPALEGATIAWTQAGLLLHLAAAHSQDPTHPDRAAELLAFTGVHPDLTSARDAVRRAVDATGPDAEPSDDPVRDVAEAGRRLAVPLAWQTGGWAALRLLTRRLPGAGTLLAGIACADANRRLAARAIAHYRATAPDRETKIVS